MGSFIELNDTLQITTEQGFPKELDLYHPTPNRCFLAHNINGKWLYWGKIIMLEQAIKG